MGYEATLKAAELAAEALRKFVKSVEYYFCKTMSEFLCRFLKTVDNLLDQALISGRVKHLAQHAKKRRVRKKNMKRICRALKKTRRAVQ